MRPRHPQGGVTASRLTRHAPGHLGVCRSRRRGALVRRRLPRSEPGAAVPRAGTRDGAPVAGACLPMRATASVVAGLVTATDETQQRRVPRRCPTSAYVRAHDVYCDHGIAAAAGFTKLGKCRGQGKADRWLPLSADCGRVDPHDRECHAGRNGRGLARALMPSLCAGSRTDREPCANHRLRRGPRRFRQLGQRGGP